MTPAEEALADLAGARVEKRAAAHVIALLGIGQEDDPTPDEEAGADRRRREGFHIGPALFVRRREIELRVAELRLSLWIDECRRLENVVRSYGLRP